VFVLLKEARINVETVLLVAITAVTRELIVFNYEGAHGETLGGIAPVLSAIAVSYCMVKRVDSTRKLVLERGRT